MFNCFEPLGPTITFTAATTAPTGVQAKSVGAPPSNEYMIDNAGSVEAFVAFGASGAAALAAAVIPTGTPTYAYRVPAGQKIYIHAGKDLFLSGITASSTAVIYVTPGRVSTP